MWARLVLRAWAHACTRDSTAAEALASRLLAKQINRRRQRELLQRWSESARDARTTAATNLITERCHAALKAALFNHQDGGAATNADAAYEPLNADAEGGGEEDDEEYTPFEGPPACAGATKVTASSSRPRRRYAPIDVESVASSASALLSDLVGKLHEASAIRLEWLSQAAEERLAAAAAEEQSIVRPLAAVALSAPVSPLRTAARMLSRGATPATGASKMPGSLPSSVGTLYDGDRHASRWTLNDLALHDEERHRLAMEEAEQQDRLCYSAAESGTEESDCEHDHDHFDHEHSHKVGAVVATKWSPAMRALVIR